MHAANTASTSTTPKADSAPSTSPRIGENMEADSQITRPSTP